MIRKRFLSLTGMLLLTLLVSSQVSVVSVNLQSFQVSPEALLNANIMNNGAERIVELQTTLSNVNNEVLATVRSNSFTLKQGLNVGAEGRTVKLSEYGSGNQANYIKSTRLLPGGRFKICVSVIAPQLLEPLDEYCDEIESEFSQYLYLVNPSDKDSIDTKYPLLIWNHSEPFSLLAQGEYYRMVVSEIKTGQTAEEAVTVNSPVMFKNYLSAHELQYPYDAKELEAGKSYAWQVQKMANGVVVNKSEGWEFVVRKTKDPVSHKYAVMKKKLDAGFYVSEDYKIFFRFDEEYRDNEVQCKLFDSNRKEINPEIKKDQDKPQVIQVKKAGYNQFEIDVNGIKIKPGFYTLEVKNAKGELFLLKVYFPK
jgi:hypothetical protein